MREMRPVVVVAGRNMGVGGPCGASKPAGTAPDSATTSAPSGANVKPRGLIRPVATTLAFDGKLGDAGCAVAGRAQASANTMTSNTLAGQSLIVHPSVPPTSLRIRWLAREGRATIADPTPSQLDQLARGAADGEGAEDDPGVERECRQVGATLRGWCIDPLGRLLSADAVLQANDGLGVGLRTQSVYLVGQTS